MADQIRVQIIYERIYKGIGFRDALYLTESEWAAAKINAAVIEAEKQLRYNRWVNVIENPPPPPPESKLTLVEAQAQVDELAAKLAAATVKLDEVKAAEVNGGKG